MTPEGKVKDKIKRVLKKHGAYYNMPVPGGFGKQGLDFEGCYKGRYFAIEAKAPGKSPTARQETCMRDIRAAGGVTFVIDGDTSNLEWWLAHGLTLESN